MQTTVTPGFRKTADTFTSGATTLPQPYFISPEIFAKEQEVLSTQWVLVGHQSQIAKAGDYFVQEVAGESLIIVRDQKGDARASTMSAGIAGRGCAKKSPDTPRRSNVRITPGRMRSMEDWWARRTWMGHYSGI